MNRMPIADLFARSCRPALACLALAVASGCAGLLPKATPQPTFYALDRARVAAPAPAHNTQPARAAAPTLVVNPPRAAAGFDSPRIIYTRGAHQLEYFAHSEWVDTPARMLAPLITAALETGSTFHAVIPTPSAAAGDIRLDTEILRLQQNFGDGPGHVRFTLRAYLVENATRRVLAWREFDESVATQGEDAYGGVVAANRAVQIVLEALAGLCTEAAAGWKPPEK